MSKILFLSYRWNDQRLRTHSSDMMMSLGFESLSWDIFYHDYRDIVKSYGPIENQNQIYKEIMEINPDILFITKGEKVDPATIQKAKKDGFRGCVIGWYNDIRRTPTKCVVDISKVCDWFFHCKSGPQLQHYYQLTKTPCSFLPSPYDDAFVCPNSIRDLDVTWYGQIFRSNKGWDSCREEIIPNVRDLLSDYGACFEKGFIRGEEYYTQLGRSKISINIPAINMEFYFSNRLSHILGSGAVGACYRFPNFERMFKEDFNIIGFSSEKELREKISYYLNNLEELSEIQKNSLTFAENYLRSEKVASEILSILSSGESTYPFASIINPKNYKCGRNF